ncbi:isoleucyl-tRNA synthetase [Lentilactobacillus farraginis DSM 18382 = JCM 14108]|uniref:Isoleucyl-tRNA synthetase n=1 Tax=Lentilactobacillus farraginis DSM 18382 = JCM 14108 TaxID=1423743 RepID=X0P9J8_9LACO|nr:isoleucyl-tRNA synthetase [Lentilactobacillus farraginis DSM 18382 = JCM 14108]
MRVKDTLNLGKTKFKMRGNLPVKEVERQKAWEENRVYEQRQKLNEGKPSFVLHDGPPYANGDIHMGHAMNKISKDIIVRYKSMTGYRAPYVPGWDTHGLPIEQKLTQAGYDRKKMSTNDFRKLCQEYAMKQVKRQMTEFKRLGVSGDWQHPYLTLQHEFEAAEVRVFGAFAKRGLIYKGKKRFTGHGHPNQLWLKPKLNITTLPHRQPFMVKKWSMVKVFLKMAKPIWWFGQRHLGRFRLPKGLQWMQTSTMRLFNRKAMIGSL